MGGILRCMGVVPVPPQLGHHVSPDSAQQLAALLSPSSTTYSSLRSVMVDSLGLQEAPILRALRVRRPACPRLPPLISVLQGILSPPAERGSDLFLEGVSRARWCDFPGLTPS